MLLIDKIIRDKISFARWQRRLVASLASLVAAVRAREPGRGACGPLADRRALLLLLVASLLSDRIVMFCYGATG